MSSRVSEDFKRTQKLFSELFRRSHGFEELCFDISMGSNRGHKADVEWEWRHGFTEDSVNSW